MADSSPRQLAPLEQERRRTIERLCEHFAADGLSERSLEERLDRAYRAGTPAELRALVADLSAVRPPATHSSPVPSGPDPPLPSGERQAVVAVMGGAARKGDWMPPQRVIAVAVMGGVELDFRHARFGSRVTEVTCMAVMGGVEIVVPPGVRVELNGAAFMGGFGQRGSHAPADPGAPVLRVNGVCLMGGVEVQVRLPGETAGDANQREKLERKRARKLSSGG